MTSQAVLNRYIESGLLRKTSDANLDLYCYTQDCFFSGDAWDNVTRTHRGALYQNGQPVNHPFDKIFNLDEMPETDEDRIQRMMEAEDYTIMDKANGHLLIVSKFIDEHTGQTRVVLHTKGSMAGPNNTLLNKDIEKFQAYIEESAESLFSRNKYVTLLFEAIVDHDKHTMYDVQARMHGENEIVLLGCYMKHDDSVLWSYAGDYNTLSDIASEIGVPPVPVYPAKKGMPSSWLDDTGTEGYVIWFPKSDFRVKIKTKEYWALRFKNDLSAERIVRMFRAGGHDRIHLKLPEELAHTILDVLENEFTLWYHTMVVNADDIWHHMVIETDPDSDCKKIMQNPELSQEQKTFLVNTRRGKKVRIFESKKLRKRFFKDFEQNEMIREGLQDQLEEIVNNM